MEGKKGRRERARDKYERLGWRRSTEGIQIKKQIVTVLLDLTRLSV